MSDTTLEEKLAQAAALLRRRLGGRVWELHVALQGSGVVLRGRALSYYVKQLAQHTIMEDFGLPVLANEIEVHPGAPMQRAADGDSD
jgi:hypothetical protein